VADTPQAPAVPVAAAPVTPPAEKPAAEIRMADVDGHVVLKTARGEDEIVPLSVLIKDAQMYKSGQQILDEGKEKSRVFAAELADGNKWRQEQELLARDPKGYAALKLRQASIANGAPIELQQPNTQTDDDGDPVPRNSSATEARLARVEANQHQIATNQHQERITREIREALDEYPALKDPTNADLRVEAEKVLLAAKVLDANSNARAEARSFHSALMRSLGASRTVIRDTRQDRVANMPAISPQTGIPDAKALEALEAPKAADLKRGGAEWRRKGMAFLTKLQGGGG
jgi:hypothetical protein